MNYVRKNSRVYLPTEEHKYDWIFAKICVQVRTCWVYLSHPTLSWNAVIKIRAMGKMGLDVGI